MDQTGASEPSRGCGASHPWRIHREAMALCNSMDVLIGRSKTPHTDFVRRKPPNPNMPNPLIRRGKAAGKGTGETTFHWEAS